MYRGGGGNGRVEWAIRANKCKSRLFFCIKVWRESRRKQISSSILSHFAAENTGQFTLCWFNCVVWFFFFFLIPGTFRCPILSPVGVSVCVHSWHVCICVYQAYSSRRISPEYSALFLSLSSFCDSRKALIRSSSSLFSSHLLSNPSLQLAVDSNRMKPRSTMQLFSFIN